MPKNLQKKDLGIMVKIADKNLNKEKQVKKNCGCFYHCPFESIAGNKEEVN